MPRTLKPCGTPAAYVRHKAHGEAPCQPCRDAYNAYMRENERNRTSSRARQRAYRRLANIYATAFEQVLDEEFAKAVAEEEAKGGGS